MHEINNIHNLQLVDLDINSIVPNPCQPRKIYHDADIASLSLSIIQNGLLEPIRVIKKGKGYELLYGHRRLLAAKNIGMDKILAIIQPEVCEKLEKAVVENTQRKDLSPLDEAEAFQSLCIVNGHNLKQLSQKVDKSVSLLSETLKMNKIPADVKDECRRHGHLSFRFLKELSKYGDADGIRDAYKYYTEFDKLPCRSVRKYGKHDRRIDFMDKLIELISDYRNLNLDAEKDEQFMKQIKEQIDLFNSML
jgi:ParB/RepB/Spo0J family partition protein